MSKARPLPPFPPLQVRQSDDTLKTLGKDYALFYDSANDTYHLQLYSGNIYFNGDRTSDPWTLESVQFTNQSYHYVLNDNQWVPSGNGIIYTLSQTPFCFSSSPIREGGYVLSSEGSSFDPNSVVVRGTELMPESWYPTLGTVLIPSDLIATLQGCSMLASILLPVVVGFLAFRKAYGFIKLTLGGA